MSRVITYFSLFDMHVPGFASYPNFDSNEFTAVFYPYGTGRCVVALKQIELESVEIDLQGRYSGTTLYNGNREVDEPAAFGGIAVDNSANGGPDVILGRYGTTTFVPNSSTSRIDYIYVVDVGLLKVLHYCGAEDFVNPLFRLGLVCEDPTNYFGSLPEKSVIVIDSRIGAPRKVVIQGDGTGPVWIGRDGEYFQNYNYPRSTKKIEIGDGLTPVRPFILFSQNSTYVTLSY